MGDRGGRRGGSHLKRCVELLREGLAHLLHHRIHNAPHAVEGLGVHELHPVKHALQTTIRSETARPLPSAGFNEHKTRDEAHATAELVLMEQAVTDLRSSLCASRIKA